MPAINTGFLSLLASCVLMLFAGNARADAAIDTSRPAKAAPVSYVDGNGRVQSLAPAGSKLTIVHFWATWCAPCVEELAEVDAAQATYEGRATFVAISLDGDGTMEKVKAFLREHKLTRLNPNLDNQMASYKAADINGLPTTLFIDQKGNEIGRAEGAVDWSSSEVRGFLDKQVK